MSDEAILTVAPNITRPRTGPRTIISLRFFMTFITSISGPLSLDARGSARCAGQPLALELSHVGNDRPPVCGRDRPAVPRHQPEPVRDHVEDLPVRVLQDLFLVEGSGGNVAALEQDSLAVTPSVVTRLAIDCIPLVAPLDKRLVHRHRARRNELAVRSLAREEGLVFFQPTDWDRSWNGLAHRRAVVEEPAGRLGEHLRLVVHTR